MSEVSTASSGMTKRALPTPLVIAIVVLTILALRWPLLVTIETLRGEGFVDRTIVAFAATFFMIAAGLPGVVIASSGGTRYGQTVRLIGASSLLSLLAGCLGSLGWIGASVRTIGVTLSPLQIVVSVVPPLAAALAAVWLRVRLGRDRVDT